MDIKRHAKESYMTVISDETDESVHKNVQELIENRYTSINIVSADTIDSARSTLDTLLEEYNTPLIVIGEYSIMNPELQDYLAQSLQDIAEQHTEIPIIVYDSEGGNLTRHNPDLQEKIYTA